TMSTGVGFKDCAPRCFYDEKERILFVDHPTPLHLRTKAEISAYFQSTVDYWRANCPPKGIYAVVDYDGLTFEHEERSFYATQIAHCLKLTGATFVRYGGTISQRAAARNTAAEIHVPSNLYASRQEAIEVVRALRSGAKRLGHASPMG